MQVKQVWYSDKVDLNSADTVHQVLMYGSLRDIESLKAKVGVETVKKLFLSHPKKVYNASALNFMKNFILGINNAIDEQKYLKNTPRTA